MSNCSHHSKQNVKYADAVVKLSKDRIIFLSEEVDIETSNALSSLLIHYDNINNDIITIYINTNGGNVAAMLNIFDVMKMIKSPIQTICIGKAYSAGAFILSSGDKGLRCAMQNSSIMIHGMQAQFPIEASVKKSKEYFDYLKRLNNSVLEIIAVNTGKDLETVRLDCDKDYFMDAKEALQYGLIDKII
jgi:ATP-dependent Clp protease protease subunit